MKKVGFVFVVMLSLLVLTTGTVFAAPPTAGNGYVVLVETRNDPNGNVIFVFDFVGEFNKFDFRGGSVLMGDQRFTLGCNIVDEDTVQCTTTRATSGQYVTIHLAGFVFYTRVPERAEETAPPATEYCYPVFDTDEGEWVQFDTHCQNTPAQLGDYLIYFSEVFYEFFTPDVPICWPPNTVDGFYRDSACFEPS